MSKKPFTVLLLYPEYMRNNDSATYQAHVNAVSSAQAGFFAQFEAAKANENEVDEKEDFQVLAVYEGHLEDQHEG